jgi:malate dehydrogenase (quinone)
MFNHLNELEGVSIHFNHEVRTLKQRKDKTWRITDLATGQKKESVQFVFIGAGGGLPLLEKQMFQKEKVLAVSRKWAMAQMYQSGRYCKAPIKKSIMVKGAPPMSVPHIDSRMINGENSCCLALCWFFNPILKKWILFRLAFIHKTRQYFSDVVSRNKKYTVD